MYHWKGLRRTAARVGLVLCVLAVTPTAPVRADDDEARFVRSFERLRGFPKRGLYEDGLRKLKVLLKRNARKPYVYGRRLEIEDLVQRLAFANDFAVPGPGDVVSGRVQKWDAQKGYLVVRYTPHTASDLVRRGRLLFFPMDISGPFLLDVKGKRYPQSIKTSPAMVFGGELHPKTQKPVSWEILFGRPPITSAVDEAWLPPTVIEHHGDEEKRAPLETARSEHKVKIGRPYAIQLKVTATRVAAAIRGRSIGHMKKPAGMWGQVGFDAETWTSATFTGTVEPAWIQSRIDKLAQARRAKFEQSYDASKYLPMWLLEKPPSDPNAPAPAASEPLLPVALESDHQPAYRKYETYVAKARWGSALSAVRKLAKAGAPPCVTTYLVARVRMLMGQAAKSLAKVDESLETHPTFLGALLLRGEALRRLGRVDEAAAVFDAAVKANPRSVEAHVTGITQLLLASRPEAAQAIAQHGASQGLASDELTSLGRMLVRVEVGPKWARAFDHKSRNYHVCSDIDKNSCLEASRLLEEALTSYRVNFHWVSRDKTHRFKVYLFSGRDGFRAYAGASGLGAIPDGVAGLYSPMTKQLMIWNLPSRAEFLRTIRHEGFHQYLDRLMPDPPIWFNEGLAVYHENATKNSQGRLVFGQMHPRRIALLQKKPPAYLSKFLFLTPAKFYDGGLQSYAQAWVLVHMLKHGKPKHRALFEALVTDLKTEHAYDVMKKHFPPDRLQDLETDFRTYLRGLARK